MKYLLLIYSNPAVWDSLSEDERTELGRGHVALGRKLMESGEMVGGEGLSDPVNTRTVRVRGGVATTTDGPYVEAKEHLAGYYVVDCEDPERVAAIAAEIPDAALTGIEIRPVMDLSGLEM